MSTEGPNRHEPQSYRGTSLAALVLLLAILLVFGSVIIAGDAKLLGNEKEDIATQEYGRHLFDFGQLARGNFPLWCPKLFCGYPSFGGMQSGLLYPPNVCFLCMSAVKAINWSFILHEFLGGMFMYLWLARQKLHHWACIAGALMFAFCAPFFLRIYAGHLTVNNTIAWIPLVLLAIDGIIATPTLGWLLLGTAAVSMELLAGYPQVLFYTAIGAGLYTLARLHESPRFWKSVAYLALMNIFVLALTCVQWAAGIAATNETVRSGGVPYSFAASLSLTPESWLTLIRPGIFGDMQTVPYWGRWYFWEMWLYFGVVGFFFAIVGLFHAKRRAVLPVAVVAVAMSVLAMGAYSPHFRFFYDHVPGFNLFRSNSKFNILVVGFLIFLSAHGLDTLFRDQRKRILGGIFVGALASCVVLAVMLLAVVNCSADRFKDIMNASLKSHESYLIGPQKGLTSPESIANARKLSAGELGAALGFLAALSFVLGAIWWLPGWRCYLAAVVVGLIGVESLLFARRMEISFSPAILYQPLKECSFLKPLDGDRVERQAIPNLNEFLRKNLNGGRILSFDGRNLALLMDDVSDLWGYGPASAVRRYAEFIAYTQGTDADDWTGYQAFKRTHQRFDMLRCKYVVIEANNGSTAVIPTVDLTPLPQFLLIADWRVDAKRDRVLKAICDRGFDPRTSVVLERNPTGWTAPKWSPMQEMRGTIHVLGESTDWQEVEVKLDRSAILLETDLYTPNWHVRALPGSSQQNYELIPANYILRGIPLDPGVHRLRIEYRPIGFVIGRWISLVSLVGFISAIGAWAIRRITVRTERVRRVASTSNET